MKTPVLSPCRPIRGASLGAPYGVSTGWTLSLEKTEVSRRPEPPRIPTTRDAIARGKRLGFDKPSVTHAPRGPHVFREEHDGPRPPCGSLGGSPTMRSSSRI